ncbi:MAG: ribonuclease HI family protein [bacterium]
MKIILNTDGGSRGNPGPAAIGIAISDLSGAVLKTYGETIGVATNNDAEYQALIFGLKKIKLLFGGEKAKQMSIECRLDSELVVKQLDHEYKLKEERIQKFFIEIWNLMLDFGSVSFTHIPREQNKLADKCVNEALDKKESKTLF